MVIASFSNIGEEGILDFAEHIDGRYYCNCDKDLSFVLLDDRQGLIGFVLLKSNSIPNTYIIDEEVYTRENGVEILQIYYCDLPNEPLLLRELVNRVTIWAHNGVAAFNYIWSINLNDATHFYADVLNGNMHNVLISADTRKQLLYSIIERDEE